jgi:hypothetical protein
MANVKPKPSKPKKHDDHRKPTEKKDNTEEMRRWLRIPLRNPIIANIKERNDIPANKNPSIT